METITERLKELALEQEEIDSKASEIDYFETNYSVFGNVLYDALVVSKNKNEYAKEVIDNLDIVLRFTNRTNINWVLYESLLSQDNYVEKFIDNIQYFRFDGQLINLLIIILYNHLGVDDIRKRSFFSDKLLDYLTKIDIKDYDLGTLFIKMSNDDTYRFLEYMLKNKASLNYIDPLFPKKCEKFVYDNILDFAENCQKLYSLKRSVQYHKEPFDKICEYIDNNEKQAYTSLFNELKLDTKEEWIYELIELIVKDLVVNENAKLSDITIQRGNYSTVLMIKDKVLKVGEVRATKRFADNPYIVRPLLRRSFDINEDEELMIEVTERVEDKCDATREELYSLYKRLRDIGLVWTDIAPRNVGRLLKDNKVYWYEDLFLDSKSLGLEEYRGTEELKQGDVVILDADYIYDENNSNIFYTNPCVSREFEETYQGTNIVDLDNEVAKGLKKIFGLNK